MITDAHLANLIRRMTEELQNNRPVQAHMFLGDLVKYLSEEEFRPAKPEQKQRNGG